MTTKFGRNREVHKKPPSSGLFKGRVQYMFVHGSQLPPHYNTRYRCVSVLKKNTIIIKMKNVSPPKGEMRRLAESEMKEQLGFALICSSPVAHMVVAHARK